MRQLREWSGITWPNWTLQLLGTGFFLLPLLMRRAALSTASFRIQYLCSLLVYVVLFNHQAERQSYVIAAAGCPTRISQEMQRPGETRRATSPSR